MQIPLRLSGHGGTFDGKLRGRERRLNNNIKTDKYQDP